MTPTPDGGGGDGLSARIDPELVDAIPGSGARGLRLEGDGLSRLRQILRSPPIESILADRDVRHCEACAPAHGSSPEVDITLVERSDHSAPGPGILALHGGGMVAGDRRSGLGGLLEWVERFDAVLVSPEYRLAPEHPFPAALDDCWTALLWMSQNAAHLGIDARRILLVGASAGGGLAAGLALRARDVGGPELCGQLLMSPMLDHRDDSASTLQVDGWGVWDRVSNRSGWDALLGPDRGGAAVSAYASPALADDLSGLPPAFIDCGSAEVFRDEDVAYASRIWAQGGSAELHVWPGAFHGFDQFVPQARVSVAAREARNSWLARHIDGNQYPVRSTP